MHPTTKRQPRAATIRSPDESRSGATKASARLLRLSRRAAGRFWWGLPLRIDEPSEQELSRRSRVGDDPEATWLTDGRGAARDVV